MIGTGSLEVDGSFGQRVTFAAGSTATLVLGDSAAFTGAVLGFSKSGTNHIDLKDVAYDAGDVATYTANKANPASGGTLKITDGTTVVATLHLAGTDYTGSTFNLTEDSSGGTIITDPSASSAPAVLTQAMANQINPASRPGANTMGLLPKLPMVHGHSWVSGHPASPLDAGEAARASRRRGSETHGRETWWWTDSSGRRRRWRDPVRALAFAGGYRGHTDEVLRPLLRLQGLPRDSGSHPIREVWPRRRWIR